MALSQVTILNPIYGATPGTIAPTLVQILGPPANTSTITGSLTSEYNTVTLPINDLFNQFSSGVNDIGKSFPTVSSSLQSGVSQMSGFQSSLMSAENQTDTYVENVFTWAMRR